MSDEHEAEPYFMDGGNDVVAREAHPRDQPKAPPHGVALSVLWWLEDEEEGA